MNKYVNVFFAVFVSLPCFSQYKIVKKSLVTDTTLYTVRNSKIKPTKGFYFTITEHDTTYDDGYKLFSSLFLKDIQNLYPEKMYAWRSNLNKPIRCINDTTFLQFNMYTKDIDSVEILFHSAKNNRWYGHTVKSIDNGYKMSLFLRLSYFKLLKFDKRETIKTESFTDNKFNNILDEFIFIAYNKNKHGDIIIGSFEIFNATYHESLFYHPLFDKLLNINSMDSITSCSLDHLSSSPIILQSLQQYSKPDWCRFYIIPEKSSYDTLYLLYHTVREIFLHYPFYKEKSINRDDMLNKFENIFTLSNYKLIKEKLTNLIDSFSDPHFLIPKKTFVQRKKNSPIMLYEINSKIKIAANFDNNLRDLCLNDNVISINNKPIETLINDLKGCYHGNELTKRQKIISSLLNSNLFGDSILIKIERHRDTIERFVKYDNYRIPPNFIPKHCEFKRLENDICYFRLRTFDINTWIRFYNFESEIKKSKALIIDVRGNGGGDERCVLNMLSTFINNSVVVYHDYFPPYNTDKETVVIKPNKLFHFNIPVVVLINNQTLCAAEALAYLLRKHAGAKIIGSSGTGGAFAGRCELVYPDRFELVFNCLSKIVFENDYSIENVGIEPDIYVRFNNILDLAPYNDKMLKTAIKILTN